MSLNTFADHAPKPDWVRDVLCRQESVEKIDDFLVMDLGLGPVQKTKFKRFLSDAGIVAKNSFTDFAKILLNLGWDSTAAWGLILTKLVAENPQVRWYVDNLAVGREVSSADVESMLQDAEVKAKDASSIRKAFKRLVNLPLGTKLGWGFYQEQGRGDAVLGRRPCRLAPDDRLVVLYALYVFAEKCGDFHQFSLSRLMDGTVESGGVSPAKLFGLDRDAMVDFLNGLGAAYNEFINVSFTHDLEKISLREDKTSADVLALFR